MTDPHRPRRTSNLFAIIEALQRRLEGQGLHREVVDVTVVHALQSALRR